MLVRIAFVTLFIAGALPALGAGYGVTSNRTKISDSTINGGMWGPGFNNLIVSGDEVYAGFSTDDGLGSTRVEVARSRDGGKSWDGSMIVARGPGYQTQGAAVAVGPAPGGGRRLHVVWGGSGGIWNAWATLPAAGSADPLAFTAPVQVNGTTSAMDWTRSVFADPQGRVHVVFAAEDGIYYVKSDDFGSTFPASGLTRVAATATEPYAAYDTSGNVFVVFVDSGNLMFARTQSGAWSSPTSIGAFGVGSGTGHSIAMSAQGTLYVTGRNTTSALVVLTSGNGGLSWSLPVVVGPTAGDNSIAVSPNGDVAVVWFQRPTIYLSRSTNQGATWSAAAAVSSELGTDGLAHLALDASGKALVAFQFTAGANQIAFTREK